MKFSANLGFLWTELALPDAIRRAKKSGFDAVECHWPYDTAVDDVNDALAETGIKMLSLNTVRGDVKSGENGLLALVGRENEARVAIDQALDYAVAINTKKIHVMAGIASGEKAHQCYLENLRYAAEKAQNHGITILIEPLNHFDVPGYFLNTSTQAKSIIDELGIANLKLMFDCYHIQIMEGDITRRIKTLLPYIGHIQIASVPDRSEPDHGELNYSHIFRLLKELGYSEPLGAEYKPTTTVDAGLGWMKQV